jgi:hypothetical protein
MTARKSAGKQLVERITADMQSRGLRPDAKESELLTVAEVLADQLAGLRRQVRAQGYSTTLKTGRIVENPAVALINSTAKELKNVLCGVQMDIAAPVNAAKQRAAQTRWREHNIAKTRLEGGA